MQKSMVRLMLGIEIMKCYFASAKYGVIVTDLKGSIGGTTFKGTSSGGVLQNKITRAAQGKNGGKVTKSDAGRLINTQQNQTANIQKWRVLSDLQRATWVAGAPSFPFINKFGESYTPSAYQLFLSVNNNRLATGAAALNDCPLPGAVTNCPAISVTASIGGAPVFEVTSSNVANHVQTLYCSGPQSSGKNFDSGRMKAIAVFPAGTSWPQDIDGAYQNVFGTIPVGGNYWFEMKITKSDAGRQGLPYRVNVVMT